jgi:hypothetical protein
MQTLLHSIPKQKCLLQGSLSIVPHAFDPGGTSISSATKNQCSDPTNWSQTLSVGWLYLKVWLYLKLQLCDQFVRSLHWFFVAELMIVPPGSNACGTIDKLPCSKNLEKTNGTFPTVPPAGQTNKWKVLKPRVKAENVPKWAQPSQENIWESEWEVRDGAGLIYRNQNCTSANVSKTCSH